MSRFYRLQWLVILLSLVTFGMSAGFLMKGIPTVMPFVFFGTLVAFVATFLIKKPVATGIARTKKFVAPVKHSVVHTPISVTRAAIGRTEQIKKSAENAWTWVIKQLENAATYLKPKMQAAKVRANQGRDLFADNVKQSPLLWLGIAFSVLASFQLYDAYSNEDWKVFGSGLVSVGGAVIFFLYHFKKMDIVYSWLMKEWKGVWLGLSIGSVFLSIWFELGFTAYLLSVASAICALITFRNEWGKVKKKAFETTTGEINMGKLLLVFCFATLFMFGLFFSGDEILSDEDEAWARLMSLLYVALFFAVIGLAIYKVHKKMK